MTNTETEKKIIDSFPEPKDDFDRVDYNIDSNRLSKRIKKKNIIINIAAMIVIPVFIILYCVNRLFIHRIIDFSRQTLIIESSNRKGVKYNFEGRIPIFGGKYGSIRVIDTGVFPKFREGIIGLKAFIIFCKFVARHPFDGFNNLRMLVNLMGYNKLLYVYSPIAIVNSRMELNQNSSLITFLCEESDCMFINFMHGEVLYNITTSFVRFSKFYVWDEHYINVFSWSRSPVEQFEVYKPGIFNVSVSRESSPEYDYTYIFLGDEKEGQDENANTVKAILQKLEIKGEKCKVRPHPRWSNANQLKQIFADTDILVEDPKHIDVAVSLSNTKKVIGTYSTVMSEAYYSGIGIVIDDVSNREVYDSLYERGYILVNKQHELLSQIIEEESIF